MQSPSHREASSSSANEPVPMQPDNNAVPGWLGIPGIRHTIGLAREWHFSFDLFWLINGIIFYIMLFTTNQWKRLVPQRDVFRGFAARCAEWLCHSGVAARSQNADIKTAYLIGQGACALLAKPRVRRLKSTAPNLPAGGS